MRRRQDAPETTTRAATGALPDRTLIAVTTIVEAALTRDHGKVIAYAEHLAEQLLNSGQGDAAKRLTAILKRVGAHAVSPMSSASASLPVDSESRFALAEEVHVTEAATVILQPQQDAVIADLLRFYRAGDRLEAAGVGVTPSLLLHGPPGCGKTALGHFIASELGLPLVIARIDSLISSYLGSTAKNLRLLFDHARMKPCVLFLDEFDAIAKLRDDSNELGELKRVVISLLQNIDLLGRNTILIAATNHAHLLDPAVWRRFAFRLELQLPDVRMRYTLFARFLRGTSTDELDLFAALSEGLSGAAIKACAEDAIREAVLADEATPPWPRVVKRLLESRGIRLSDDKRAQLVQLRELAPDFFTQPKLADYLGISTSYVQKLLTNRR